MSEGGKKPVVVVLGGTFPHAELIRKLKHRGYYTILADYFDNPPAAAEADEHSKISALDYDAVFNLAKSRGAQLVMSPCADQLMAVAMQVSEALGLSRPFPAETALNATNKKHMKRIMVDNGIPTSRYFDVAGNADLDAVELDYPVIVKPADSNSASGVFKLSSPSGLKRAVEDARAWSRTGGVIVEEFKRGMEVSVYTFIRGGKATIVTTTQRISVIEEKGTRCFCGVSPAPLSKRIYEKMGDIATQLARAFGLDNTPLFYQCLVDGDDVFVLEFSPRMGGGMCYRIMQLNAKFEMLDAAIQSYLGETISGDPQREEANYLVHQVHGLDGVFDHLEGIDDLIAEGVVDEVHYVKTPGMAVGSSRASESRVAMLLFRGASDDELLEKLAEAMPRLEVRDPDGRPFMDRSLQLTEEILEESRRGIR